MSELEEEFAAQLDAAGVKYQRELMLIPNRKFRFDFVIPQANLVAEVEGGTWRGGRHTSGAGFRKDCEKYNLALEHGWRVLRFTTDMVRKGLALESVVRVLSQDVAAEHSDGL
jgi:very-short-patch-repair endonuclease|tara:strand:+ start:133 stop:471 length:339 start_codon:yes stop_codon:yes gene_type:complete